MNTVTSTDTNKNGYLLNGSTLLDQISIHAEGRDKVMDNEYNELLKKFNERMDIVNMVSDKIETVNNLIEFYFYARAKTGFTKDAINGLCLILSDCTAQLKEVVK